MAAGGVAQVSEKTTVGADLYPAPAFVMVTLLTNPVDANVAVAVAVVPVV